MQNWRMKPSDNEGPQNIASHHELCTTCMCYILYEKIWSDQSRKFKNT